MTRTISFAPLFGSTVGFDDLVDTLSRSADEPNGQPPYNIERFSDDTYRVSLAVAGYGHDDLDITVRDNELVVTGQRKSEDKAAGQFLYKGITLRNFQRTFRLADYVVVKSAELKDGLLRIDLLREIPEEQKPRRIEIRSKPELKAIENTSQKVA